MAKFEVAYTYTVDAKAVVDAPDREAAEAKLEDFWRSKVPYEEFIEGCSDFEIVYSRRR